jgi:WXG100 family type VII secretion target
VHSEVVSLTGRSNCNANRGVNVAGVLRIQLEVTADTAQVLSQQADELDKELADITRSWGELSAKWVGKARSAYEPAWEEWHGDAQTVVAVFEEHSALLVRSVSLLAENEAQAATVLGSLGQRGDR